MSSEENSELSELAEAIQSKSADVKVVDVSGFFGLGKKRIFKIAFRVAKKMEENDAVIRAHLWLKEKADDLKAISEDDDIILDLKNVHILFSVCRRAEEGDEEGNYLYPAFPGPQWMMDNLTTDQIAALLNTYNDLRAKLNPEYYEFDYENLARLRDMCASESDEITAPLMGLVSREWLAEAFIAMSRMVDSREKEIDVLSRRDEDEDRHQSGGAEAGGHDGDSGKDKATPEKHAEGSGEVHASGTKDEKVQE